MVRQVRAINKNHSFLTKYMNKTILFAQPGREQEAISTCPAQ
jgi:hypothetical protein